MRPNLTTSPQGSRPMMLVIQCPVCTQSLMYRGESRSGHTTRCPVCEAPIRLRNPRLGDEEILSILGRPAVQF